MRTDLLDPVKSFFHRHEWTMEDMTDADREVLSAPYRDHDITRGLMFQNDERRTWTIERCRCGRTRHIWWR